jgi:hypothetical protein
MATPGRPKRPDTSLPVAPEGCPRPTRYRAAVILLLAVQPRGPCLCPLTASMST